MLLFDSEANLHSKNCCLFAIFIGHQQSQSWTPNFSLLSLHCLVSIISWLLQSWRQQVFYRVPFININPSLTSHESNPTGGAVEAELERAVHPERCPVCSAHTHGPSAGRRWLSLVAHVRRACGVLHGPGQGVPGPGGQAQQVAGGHGRVQLPQSHRALFLWWVDCSYFVVLTAAACECLQTDPRCRHWAFELA